MTVRAELTRRVSTHTATMTVAVVLASLVTEFVNVPVCLSCRVHHTHTHTHTYSVAQMKTPSDEFVIS